MEYKQFHKLEGRVVLKWTNYKGNAQYSGFRWCEVHGDACKACLARLPVYLVRPGTAIVTNSVQIVGITDMEMKGLTHGVFSSEE
jgi:hypothetical protein